MGQIFNRIKRIIKSYEASSPRNYHIPDEDEELKNIIDGLNNNGNKKSNSSNGYRVFVEEPDYPPDYLRACRVLGIRENTNIENIKGVYKSLIKENHPDKFSRADKSKLEAAEKRTREINEAYNIIRKYKKF